MDADGNGSLSSSELRNGFEEEFKLEYTDEEWIVVMREVDPDQSNHVDREEFEEVLYGEGNVPTPDMYNCSLKSIIDPDSTPAQRRMSRKEEGLDLNVWGAKIQDGENGNSII